MLVLNARGHPTWERSGWVETIAGPLCRFLAPVQGSVEVRCGALLSNPAQEPPQPGVTYFILEYLLKIINNVIILYKIYDNMEDI